MTDDTRRKARRLAGRSGAVPGASLAAPVALAVALVVALAGCGRLESARDVRVTILDEAGNPLPGAVFYVEAYDEGGPFAFLAARAGDAGEVPNQAREPLELPWRPGAHLALAAFAPGRRPAIHRDPGRRLESDGVVLTLVAAATPAEEWQPSVAELGYPFVGDPGGATPTELAALAAQVARPEYAFLREAFARAEASRPGVRGSVQESATKRRDPQTSATEGE